MSRFLKNDRDAVIILLLIIIICIIIFPFIGKWTGTEGKDAAETEQREDSLGGEETPSGTYYYAEEKQTELFTFDPNTADSTELLRLGLRPWQVKNIYKYRAAGGRYRKPTDFARLYGLTLKQYKRLEPYIQIAPEVMAADVYGKTDAQEQHVHRDTIRYASKIKQGEHIDINTADTSLLKRIPGIGSYYARQIIYKRKRLGGFSSVSQLLEIDGFPESSLQYMTTGNASSQQKQQTETLAKIKINHLDVKALASHPYIRYTQAKDIFNYRRTKGAITSAADLIRLPSFTAEDVKRLEPYIDFSK